MSDAADRIVESLGRVGSNGHAGEEGPVPTGTAPSSVQSWDGTDVANGEAFVADHADRARWCGPWGSWLVWDGSRWERDVRDRAVELAKDTARRLAEELATKVVPGESDAARRQRMAKAAGFQNAGRIRAMLELARSDPKVSVVPDDLDADPWLLNTTTGTVNLRTGAARAHDPADLCTKVTKAGWHADAVAPIWHAFLSRILPDPEVRAFVQAALGYACTGVIRDHVLCVAWGSGANGKSTLLDAVAEALGDYAQAAPPELIAPNHDEHPTLMADLQGARLVVTSELDDGRRLAEATVKRLTGGDPVKARYMRQDLFQFNPTWHMWLGTNHRPRISGTDHAIWRRLRLIPFTVTVPDEEQDRQLPAKLAAEGPGILAWLLAGCAAWRTAGSLPNPLAVRMATDDYRAGQDALGAFLADRCHVEPDATGSAADMYASYRSWAESTGERILSQRRFGEGLAERGLEQYRTAAARRWRGVGLLSDGMTLLTGETA